MTMESIQLSHLWTAASVLAGFQIAALTWRFQREIAMEQQGYRTWLTIGDAIAMISFLVLLSGVFAGPVLDVVTIDLAAKLFGLSLVAFSAYPFVLAGHYNLYSRWGRRLPRDRVTKQERVALALSSALLVGYVVGWCLG